MKKRILVIGSGGAVGRAFCSYLECNRVHVKSWDRKKTPLDDFSSVTHKLMLESPDVVYNFAVASLDEGVSSEKINLDLPVHLATVSKSLDFKLVQTSTVMVFGEHQKGPFDLTTCPDPDTSYGKEKYLMEQRILALLGKSVILRLGWQIGSRPGSNNMVDFIERSSKNGGLDASDSWLPSCSTLTETAAELWRAAEYSPGLYQFNTNEGISFFDIASDLKHQLQKDHWKIKRQNFPAWNQLMKNLGVTSAEYIKNV